MVNAKRAIKILTLSYLTQVHHLVYDKHVIQIHHITGLKESNTMSETTQLTEGQQGVIRAYDNEIAKHQRNLEAAKQAWVNGASYDDVREHDREIERLSQWRREDLEAFARQNEAQATPAAPNETQARKRDTR
jgi:hypothetical protein